MNLASQGPSASRWIQGWYRPVGGQLAPLKRPRIAPGIACDGGAAFSHEGGSIPEVLRLAADSIEGLGTVEVLNIGVDTASSRIDIYFVRVD